MQVILLPVHSVSPRQSRGRRNPGNPTQHTLPTQHAALRTPRQRPMQYRMCMLACCMVACCRSKRCLGTEQDGVRLTCCAGGTTECFRMAMLSTYSCLTQASLRRSNLGSQRAAVGLVMSTRGRWRARPRRAWTVSPFGKAREVCSVAMLVAGSGVRHAAEEGAICWPLAVARATSTVSPFGKAREVCSVAMLVAGSGVRHAAEEGAICWPPRAAGSPRSRRPESPARS
jgi:hypothetical protein